MMLEFNNIDSDGELFQYYFNIFEPRQPSLRMSMMSELYDRNNICRGIYVCIPNTYYVKDGDVLRRKVKNDGKVLKVGKTRNMHQRSGEYSIKSEMLFFCPINRFVDIHGRVIKLYTYGRHNDFVNLERIVIKLVKDQLPLLKDKDEYFRFANELELTQLLYRLNTFFNELEEFAQQCEAWEFRKHLKDLMKEHVRGGK